MTILFKQYGIKLDFTPFVNPDGTIRLKVTPEVSALDYQNQVIIAGYVLPAISTRKAETEIELRDGQSFGIYWTPRPSYHRAAQQSTWYRGYPHTWAAFPLEESESFCNGTDRHRDAQNR